MSPRTGDSEDSSDINGTAGSLAMALKCGKCTCAISNDQH